MDNSTHKMQLTGVKRFPNRVSRHNRMSGFCHSVSMFSGNKRFRHYMSR